MGVRLGYHCGVLLVVCTRGLCPSAPLTTRSLCFAQAVGLLGLLLFCPVTSSRHGAPSTYCVTGTVYTRIYLVQCSVKRYILRGAVFVLKYTFSIQGHSRARPLWDATRDHILILLILCTMDRLYIRCAKEKNMCVLLFLFALVSIPCTTIL
jgi:hypothetical protein